MLFVLLFSHILILVRYFHTGSILFVIFTQVHDGSSENSPFVARYCGTEVPPPYTSSGNDLWMKFRSDVSQTGSGFRLTYTVACGGIYTGQ